VRRHYSRMENRYAGLPSMLSRGTLRPEGRWRAVLEGGEGRVSRCYVGSLPGRLQCSAQLPKNEERLTSK
jgi:hypothetical protein